MAFKIDRSGHWNRTTGAAEFREKFDYLTEVDVMLERAKEVARDGGWARVEYARYADDLVILVDGYRRLRGC